MRPCLLFHNNGKRFKLLTLAPETRWFWFHPSSQHACSPLPPHKPCDKKLEYVYVCILTQFTQLVELSCEEKQCQALSSEGKIR